MILVLIDAPTDFEIRVHEILPDEEVVRGRSELLGDAAIILGRPLVDGLDETSNLRWIQLSSAGADRYVRVVRKDVVLTSARGVYGIPVAEHVFAMMLAFARSLPEAMRSASEARWDRAVASGELHGRTCGILGFGDIGREVARRAKAFGMRVVAAKRTSAAPSAGVDHLYGAHELGDLFAEADHVVNTLPDTGETYHIVNADVLARAKQGSYFYNVGRGRTVDEGSLIAALQDGRLAGAGLDVFEVEPLPVDSALWRMSNVIITPHVAGSSPREDERVAELFLTNLQRWVDGRTMLNVVDRDLGY